MYARSLTAATDSISLKSPSWRILSEDIIIILLIFLSATIYDYAHRIIEHILISYIVDGLHMKAN
ncbi:hypothetical protein A9G49_21445 [Aeromonas sp. ANP5]|nr:hypothetical protein A9G04_21460 [Aeromonas sp. ANNP30]OEC60402.1 hypothetical protein A9G49_21445 [Aeromonas sp. ANP5]